jgi:hypothetical protein
LVLQKVFSEKKEIGAGSEYSEGTAVARRWFRVLAGYCQRLEVVMCDGPRLIRMVVMFD